MRYNTDVVSMGASYGEEEIVCPSCGYVHTDSWEWSPDEAGLEGDGDFDCHDCGETFSCSRHVSVSYSTEKKK